RNAFTVSNKSYHCMNARYAGNECSKVRFMFVIRPHRARPSSKAARISPLALSSSTGAIRGIDDPFLLAYHLRGWRSNGPAVFTCRPKHVIHSTAAVCVADLTRLSPEWPLRSGVAISSPNWRCGDLLESRITQP